MRRQLNRPPLPLAFTDPSNAQAPPPWPRYPRRHVAPLAILTTIHAFHWFVSAPRGDGKSAFSSLVVPGRMGRSEQFNGWRHQKRAKTSLQKTQDKWCIQCKDNPNELASTPSKHPLHIHNHYHKSIKKNNNNNNLTGIFRKFLTHANMHQELIIA